MTRTTRIVAVTAGLAAAGALFGALAGAMAAGVVGLVVDGLTWWSDWLLGGAVLGGALGVVAAPLGAWLLLRSVPLGRAFAFLTLGAAIGAAAGFGVGAALDHWLIHLLGFLTDIIVTSMLGGLGGFVVAALRARRPTLPRSPQAQRASLTPPLAPAPLPDARS
ncbi:MAG TPA: hypothetical protein VFK13_06680 [Gemmatimonadaceae bacterium]|nr:hypothetical protein [Gemmatimonadaceae bacterium]